MSLSFFLPSGLSLLFLDLIADAPDGLEAPLLGGTLQLFTQALDMDINRTGIAVILKAPHLVQQLVAGVDTVGVARQTGQQLQLLGRSLHDLA